MTISNSIAVDNSRKINTDKAYRVGRVRGGKIISIDRDAYSLGEAEAISTGSRLSIVSQEAVESQPKPPKVGNLISIRDGERLAFHRRAEADAKWSCPKRPIQLPENRTVELWVIVNRRGEIVQTCLNEQQAGCTIDTWGKDIDGQDILTAYCTTAIVPSVASVPQPANSL